MLALTPNLTQLEDNADAACCLQLSKDCLHMINFKKVATRFDTCGAPSHVVCLNHIDLHVWVRNASSEEMTD